MKCILQFLASLFSWPALIHQLTQTPPPDISRVPLPPKPSFCVPPVAPLMWPGSGPSCSQGKWRPGHKITSFFCKFSFLFGFSTRGFFQQKHLEFLLKGMCSHNLSLPCQFSNPWIYLGFPKLLWNPDWVPAMWEVLMQSEMFEGLMPVPRLSCHQARPGFRGLGDVSKLAIFQNKIW